jgi:DNA-binding CsgD family transcriptional regulator
MRGVAQGRGALGAAVATCDCRQAAGADWRGDAAQPPVLAGRDEPLGIAGRRLAKAAAGAGQLLFIAGEVGIGKTSLLGAIARHRQADGFVVVRARAFPGDLRSPAGILLHLADDLARVSQPALRNLGAGLLARLRARPARADDVLRWRRLLAQDLTGMLAAIGPGAPVLMILDDLHWADELSLDVLSHLAGQLAARPVLVAGGYRSDELYPKLRLRDLSVRLVARRLAEEIVLPRLSLDQTAAMIGAMLGRPAPPRLVGAIHERSSGIPLHVEQLLAATGRDLAAAPRRQAVRVVPLQQIPVSSGIEAARPALAWHPLTARELEVAQLVAAGLTNRQIAERLVLAPKTISAHIEHMLEKLHAGRRTEIAAWYAAFQRT